MEPNQQQTDLPQETSPHHVYGNQHFSRDTLIASEGGAAGEPKQLDCLLPSTRKISGAATPFTDHNTLCRQAAKWRL